MGECHDAGVPPLCESDSRRRSRTLWTSRSPRSLRRWPSTLPSRATCRRARVSTKKRNRATRLGLTKTLSLLATTRIPEERSDDSMVRRGGVLATAPIRRHASRPSTRCAFCLTHQRGLMARRHERFPILPCVSRRAPMPFAWWAARSIVVGSARPPTAGQRSSARRDGGVASCAARATGRGSEQRPTMGRSHFETWGEIFGDDIMAGALIDRLLHHCHIVNIRGNSYQVRHYRDLAPAAAEPTFRRPLTQSRRARQACASQSRPNWRIRQTSLVAAPARSSSFRSRHRQAICWLGRRWHSRSTRRIDAS
jgi:IstB-like ATP binding protein